MVEHDTQKDKYVTFKSGNEYFGLKIEYVNEIIVFQEITEIPESEDYIKGLINLRGKIIPVIDVRIRFKQEPFEYNDRTCIIVINFRDTVVVPCCNVLPQLKENLPALLEQEGIAYEVVVVDEASSDGTREWLEYYSEQQRRLRHTFVPPTARYVDRRKLAITLGVRAARAPWVIITQADCRPAAEDALQQLRPPAAAQAEQA